MHEKDGAAVGALGKLARHLSPEEETVLRARMHLRAVAANATLITIGEPHDTLFFVTRGEFLVSLPLQKGPIFVGARAQGSWLGELTLLEPGPATATVTAAQDSEVLALSSADLTTLTTEHPRVAGRLIRALSEDLAHRVRTAGVVLDEAPAKAAPGFFKGVFGRLFGADAP